MESQKVLELIREAKKGNNEATEKLIERYQAIKTYDESYNTKFMTHLYFHIEAKIRKFIDKERYRVPQYVIESIKKGEQERVYFSTLENLEVEDGSIDNEKLENKVLIEKLLKYCTKQEKEVLNLLFFEGYSGQAVAEKLGMSRQWIHSIKHKALKKIRENIKSSRNF